ncbi:hypothetical protein ABZ725_37735 [Streptomyces sp. NPDC006872]|uniref:hypothetical protein n=1 Tax=Streptomyces sp. NPDC006872 TaxID=3155720 RepID=UPI0033E3E4B2
MLPYQVTGWQNESLSWKEDCYLHTMLSGTGKNVHLRGPGAESLLSHAFVNNFSLAKFPVGTAKHVVTCASNGNISADGMCLRLAEDVFEMNVREPFVSMYAASGKFDVEPFEPRATQGLIFQLGGPRALEVLENVVREDLHDLRFMRFRAARILGHEVRVVRMGMAGTLAYEVHADGIDHLTELYEEVLRVGQAFGLRVLGRLAYMSNHTENGYPQQGLHFMSDWSDPAVQDFLGTRAVGIDGGDVRTVPLRGSLQDQGREAYRLNLFEAGWGRSVFWGHDFVGRDALLAIKDDPRTRRVVTLEWNHQDVLKVYGTYFDDTPGVAREMQFPQNLLDGPSGNLQDKVVDSLGRMIGKSAGRLYTLHYKKMISLAFLDPDFTDLGQEVVVLWGEPGTRQIPIRARVARFPYLDLPSNASYDLDRIPRYQERPRQRTRSRREAPNQLPGGRKP